jgi:predicted regulator of Ras-like GTPase activity (Roadblock/LC7/MglB family)
MDHLRRAAEIDPDDISIRQAIERIRGSISRPASEPARPESPPVPAAPSGESLPSAGSAVAAEVMADPGGNGGSQKGIMLVDGNGLRLNGTLLSPGNQDVGDGVAAELAGVSKEAARTSRLLGLGGWQAIAVESPEGNLYLVAPTPETMLLTVRDPSLPMARLGLIAERAAREAREWLVSEQ